MMGFGMGFGWIGMLIMFLFWVGLILLVVWLIKSVFSTANNNHLSSQKASKGNNAMEILAQRYARGEINRQEYELMKEDLG